MAKSGYKGICRIDQPSKNTYGWYVRVSFNGDTRSKFFSDQRYEGDRAKALEEAVKYRNRAERELGKPRTDRLVTAYNSRSALGIPGVTRRTKVERKAGGEQTVRNYYEVSWSPWPGKLRRTFVSIDELGEKQALLRACSLRREKEREMYGSTIKAKWAGALSMLTA